jgi:UDP-N-acetylmuramoyl-tripeptide--D-alanyl-D-alanine ligase
MTGLRPKIANFLEDYDGFVSSSGQIDDIDYQKFSIDSRTLQSGDFFVALKGDSFDGHDFLDDALKKNASGVAAQSEWYAQAETKFRQDTAFIIVKDTLDFLQKLSTWHRSHFNIPIIAITGSNGKTTLRKMISGIFANKFSVLSSEKNQNNHIGVPLTLLKLRSSHEAAVVELGTNHPGEIGFLTELVNPPIGVITNIGKGHIGYFGSLEGIYVEKTALFDRMRSGSLIFKNADDAFLKEYHRNSINMVQVGTSEECDYQGKMISTDRYGCVKFSINDLVEIQLRIPGAHHFHNALMAAAIALHFDISIEAIKKTLEEFQPESQRMQISKENGILVINDTYNANPDSTRAAIEYLTNLQITKGRKIIVLGDMLEMGDFGEQEHVAIGKFINGRPIDYVFLFGQLSRMIKTGILETNSFKGEAHWYETHEEIAAQLKKILAPNDALLVKGSRGMKMENVLNNIFGIGLRRGTN